MNLAMSVALLAYFTEQADAKRSAEYEAETAKAPGEDAEAA